MHIVLINNRFYPAIGGSEQVVLDFANILKEKYKVTVLTTNFKNSTGSQKIDKHYEDLNGIKIIRFNALRFKKDPFTVSFSMLHWLVKNRRKYDILYTFSYGYATSWGPAILKKLHLINKPIIFQPHFGVVKTVPSLINKVFNATLGKLTIKTANYIKLLTPAYVSYFKEKGAKNISIIPPIVKKVPSVTVKQQQKILSKFKIPQNKVYLLSLGRIEKYKGIQFTLKGLALLRTKNRSLFNKLHFIIAGDGSYKQTLEIMVNQLQLPNVTFVGRVSEQEKNALFNIANIFTLLSYSGESFGLVLIEATSTGTAILASKYGAIPYVINDKKNGLLVLPENTQKVASSIAKLALSYNQFSKENILLAKRYERPVVAQKLFELVEFNTH